MLLDITLELAIVSSKGYALQRLAEQEAKKGVMVLSVFYVPSLK